MQFLKSCIAVAAIVAAASPRVAAYGESQELENLVAVCDRLDRAMSEKEDLKVDGKKAFEFAKNWLRSGDLSGSVKRRRNKIISSWENIYEPKSCSKSSWNYLVDMNSCKSPSNLEILNEPIKAYATRCLTSDYVGELIKSQAKKRVMADFVDADFIEKFYQDNRDDKPLHLDWIGDKYWLSRVVEGYILRGNSRRPDPDLNCCRPKRSFGAVNDAIKRDLAKQGKDVTNEFHNKPDALSKYLDEKLFKPCEVVARYCRTLAKEMVKVTEYYEGGQQALIASLDKDTKNLVFQHKYCEMLWLDKDLVLEEAQKMFVESENESS